ncbi:MAG: AraC family transcriptional regulator [Acidobacteria bacterium]|nr:AraC family transcriptional regulator [Acidobacteriota bacterium]
MQTNTNLTHLLPILVYIQNHLHSDLSLGTLAERACFSEFHFHRMFKTLVGETLKDYTNRLRLERAAILLRLQHHTSILEIALEVGFGCHETFSRAFKRWCGRAPSKFRAHPVQMSTNDSGVSMNQHAADWSLSPTRIKTLNLLRVAFIRHVGSYFDVDPLNFERIVSWSQQRGTYHRDMQLVGIAQDAPGITPEHKLRFDCCLQVPEPFVAEGSIGYQELPQQQYAITTYIGPLGPTLEPAYREIATRLSEMHQLEIIGIPALEFYRCTHINPAFALNHTDICLPVRSH